MQIDPSANVDAFTRLADKTGQVQLQVAMELTKQTLAASEDLTLQLLQSMQPHLGKNVDVRL